MKEYLKGQIEMEEECRFDEIERIMVFVTEFKLLLRKFAFSIHTQRSTYMYSLLTQCNVLCRWSFRAV